MPRNKLFDEDLVLHRAMELFWKNGYHGTSVQDVVSHLGLNRSSLYATFGGKKELFDQSLDLYCTSGSRNLSDFLKGEPKVKTGLKKLFKMSVAGAVDDSEKKGCFVVNTTTELIPGDAELQKAMVKHKTNIEKIFYNYLLAGKKSGEITGDKDLKSISRLVYVLLCGINVAAKKETSEKNLFSSVNAVLSLLD